MQKLKLQVQMTLDGFASRSNGELDWMWIDNGDESLFQRIADLAGFTDQSEPY